MVLERSSLLAPEKGAFLMKTSFPPFLLNGRNGGAVLRMFLLLFYFFERVHASHPLKEIVPFALVIHFSCLLRFETSFFLSFFLEKCSTCHRPRKDVHDFTRIVSS